MRQPAMSISYMPLSIMFLLAAGIAPAAAAQSPPPAGDIPSADGTEDLVDNATENVSSDAVNETVREDGGEGQHFDDATVGNSSEREVVINEVELNPRGNDVGREWIELYNPADSDANISNFKIKTSKSLTIELPDAEIGPGGTFVIELDRQMLSNIAETLVLSNASGEVVDRTPSLVDRSDDGRTWQRMPDGENEWKFAQNTKEELNDPDAAGTPGSRSNLRSAHGDSGECLGSAGCVEGMVVRIVDGDTLYVNVNGTTYKVSLALVVAPSRGEEGFIESTAFTRSLCLGNTVLVDQDDEQLTSGSSVVATVYCSSDNLNSELLDNGFAALDTSQCDTSEFARQSWARQHGC